jgi:hypothetical protein
MVAPHLQRASAEAARLGLQVHTGAGPSELFAGTGDVEPPGVGGEQVEEELG